MIEEHTAFQKNIPFDSNSFHFCSNCFCLKNCFQFFLFTFLFFTSPFFPFSFICFLFGFGSFYYYLALGGICIHSYGFHLFLYIIFVIIYLRLLHTVFNFCTCFELHESVHWWMCALHCVDPIETMNKQTNQINHRCICFCRFKERITFAWSANKSKASGQHCCNIIAQYGCVDWK